MSAFVHIPIGWVVRLVPSRIRQIIRSDAIEECENLVTAMIRRDGGELKAVTALQFLRAELINLRSPIRCGGRP